MQQGDKAEHLALTATGSCRLTGSTGRPCGSCGQQLPEGWLIWWFYQAQKQKNHLAVVI